MDDLNRAINIANQAVNAIPANHFNQASILNNLKNSFSKQFNRIRSIDNLNYRLSLYKKS
jgi:hypothetical protein